MQQNDAKQPQKNSNNNNNNNPDNLEEYTERQIDANVKALAFTGGFVSVTNVLVYVFSMLWQLILGIQTLLILGFLTLMFLLIHDWWLHCRDAFLAGHISVMHDCRISYNRAVDGTTFTLTLGNFGFGLWDYMLPALMWLLNLAWDFLTLIVRFLLGSVLRQPLFQIASWGVQLATLFFQFIGSSLGDSVGVGSASVGAGLGVGVGGTVGASTGVTHATFEGIKVAIVAMIQFFEAIGPDINKLIDVTRTWVKHFPVIFKSLMKTFAMFRSSGAFVSWMATLTHMNYIWSGLHKVQCEFNHQLMAAACHEKETQAIIANGIRAAIHDISGTYIYSKQPGCNQNSLPSNNCKDSNTDPLPGVASAGAGLCDVTGCQDDVENIIELLHAARPHCTDWGSNSQGVIACMRLVTNYSTNQIQTFRAKTPIDSISKELCFGVAQAVNRNCANLQPPFAFSKPALSYQICVADKSGLSPPLPNFQTRCACVYDTPLCPFECCNQYALHVKGQVYSMIGSLQCSQALVLYPREFFCQFENLTAGEVPPVSDLTLSALWCLFFLDYLLPVCTALPFFILNTISEPTLLNAYANKTCNLISHQEGVCLPYNATVDPFFYSMRHAITRHDFNDVATQINNAAGAVGYTPSPIITTVTAATDPPEDIMFKSVQMRACYQFALDRVNITSLKYASRRRSSPLGTLAAECNAALAAAYTTYSLQNYTYNFTLTTDGTPLTINLPGIPSGAPVFGSSLTNVGAAVPSGTTQSTTSYTCPTQTGNSITEVANTGQCAGQMQQSSNAAIGSLGNTSVSGYSAIADTTQTADPILHLGDTATINQNDPQVAAQQTQEFNYVDQSQSINNNYVIVPADQQTIPTTDAPYLSPQAPPSNAGINGNSVFYKMNSQGQRQLLGIDDLYDQIDALYANVPDEATRKVRRQQRRELRQQLGKLGAEMSKVGVRFYAKMREIFTSDDDDAILGQLSRHRKTESQRFLDNLRKDIRESCGDKPASECTPTLHRTRRTLSLNDILVTNDTALLHPTTDEAFNAYVNQALLKIGNLNIDNHGISSAEFDAFFQSEADADVNMALAYFTRTAGTQLLYLFEGFITQDAFASFLGSAAINNDDAILLVGRAGNCHNTFDNPYDCCQGPGFVPPYVCCRGWFGCFRLLGDWLFPARLTDANQDRILCTEFDSFGREIKNSLKTFVTGLARFFGASPHTKGSFLIYDKLEIPPGAFFCMIFNGIYWMYLADFLFFLFLFLGLSYSIVFSLMLNDKTEKMSAMRRQLLIMKEKRRKTESKKTD